MIETKAYIIVSCVVLQSAIFYFQDSVNNLLYKVSVMGNCNDCAFVLIYCLLIKYEKSRKEIRRWKRLKTQRFLKQERNEV